MLDRFVSVVDAASGAVAIHCDGRRSHAYTLLTAYLLRRHHFPTAGEAVAWIHIARAAAAPVAVELALVEALAAARRRSRSRAFSVCTEADLAMLTRAGRPESAAGSPFPRGPGSPRRGSCARIFSVSSPHIQCDVSDAAVAGGVDDGSCGAGGTEGSCCGRRGSVGGGSKALSAADALESSLDAQADMCAGDADGGACAADGDACAASATGMPAQPLLRRSPEADGLGMLPRS